MVEGHLPDGAVGIFGQKVGVALLPHAGKIDRGTRNIAVPGIGVLEPDLFFPIEYFRAVDIQMSFEIVDIRAEFCVVGQGQDPP